MGTGINNLYAARPVTGKNIDSRYFSPNGDGTYQFTPLMIHNIARDCEEFCKRAVIALDTDSKYTIETTVTINNPQQAEEIKKRKDKYNEDYKDKLEESERRWKEYKAEHPDEFEKKPRIYIGDEAEARFFNGYHPKAAEIGITNALQAMQLLKACKELGKTFEKGGDNYALLPIIEPLYSKEEFKEKHKEFRIKVDTELGLPAPESYEIQKEKVPVKAIIRGNSKEYKAITPDDSLLDEYVNGLVAYITSSDAKTFMAERAEAMAFLKSDNLYNTFETKDLKVVKEDDGTIILYTKMNEDLGSAKFVTIAPDPDTGDYTYTFLMNEGEMNLNYSVLVSRMVELTKALNETRNFLEPIPKFNKYVADIDSIIESLPKKSSKNN